MSHSPLEVCLGVSLDEGVDWTNSASGSLAVHWSRFMVGWGWSTIWHWSVSSVSDIVVILQQHWSLPPHSVGLGLIFSIINEEDSARSSAHHGE